MSALKKYDTMVLSSGEAGKYIAWHLASTGQRVAVVERRYVGRSCPNIACLPNKTSSTAPRLPPTSGVAKNLASAKKVGRSTWPECERASAGWLIV